jgi:hypothetical protein
MTAHPGIARTSLNDHIGGLSDWLSARFTRLCNDTEHGAVPTLYAATADTAETRTRHGWSESDLPTGASRLASSSV